MSACRPASRSAWDRTPPNYLADIVAVEGDPLVQIDALFTGVRWVMKDGNVVIDKR